MKVLKHGIISRNPDTFFRYHGWPTVCKDEDGTLYAVASGNRVSHICPFGKTLLWKSTDDGESWSLPTIVNDTWMDDRDAGIVSLGGRKLLVSWFTHSASAYETRWHDYILKAWPGAESVLKMYASLPEEKRQGGSYIRISEDGGFSFGETVKVPVSAPHGPIQLKDGSLLYAGKRMYSGPDETGEEPADYKANAMEVWKGTPDGKNWTKLAKLDPPEGTTLANFHELHAIELESGRILCVIRAQGAEVAHGFTMYQTFSDDGGVTWSPLSCIGVSGSPPHLMMHSSGALVLSFSRREEPYGERALISRDNGVTWDEECVLCEVSPRDLGYPASVELRDGSILTVYYQAWEDDPFASLLYTRWTL